MNLNIQFAFICSNIKALRIRLTSFKFHLFTAVESIEHKIRLFGLFLELIWKGLEVERKHCRLFVWRRLDCGFRFLINSIVVLHWKVNGVNKCRQKFPFNDTTTKLMLISSAAAQQAWFNKPVGKKKDQPKIYMVNSQNCFHWRDDGSAVHEPINLMSRRSGSRHSFIFIILMRPFGNARGKMRRHTHTMGHFS